MATSFRTYILNSKDRDAASLAPVRQFGETTFLYLRAANVYLLAVTRTNSNSMMIFQFLSNLVDLIKSYCHGDFNEDIVKGNFVLIYELLDDVLDHGYPQLTDPSVMKSFIFQKGFVTEATRKKRDVEAQSATLQVTGAVGWRKDSIRYKKNEVYLDIIESINVLMSSQGTALRTDVQGSVVMKTFLSGMPDIKIGFNDALADATFHPCVNLGRYNAEKVLSFVPPDGEFELAKYRCTEGIELPFKATALLTEQGRTRLDVTVKVIGTFPPNLRATNVVVSVPVPPQTARASFQLSGGRAKYDPKRGALTWKIKKFAGGTEMSLAASVDLIATARERKPWSKPPLGLSFQIPMHSVSGVRVQFMKVWEKSGYQVEKWIRKSTKSGDYQIRM